MSSTKLWNWSGLLALAMVALAASPAAAKKHAIAVTGTIQITPSDSCTTPLNSCNFDLTGSAGIPGGGAAAISGTGTVNPSTCTNNRKGTKLCCSTTIDGTATVTGSSVITDGSVIAFTFDGISCRKPTMTTLKGPIFLDSGGSTGSFAGAAGSGKLNGKLNSDSLGGSVAVHAHYTLPAP